MFQKMMNLKNLAKVFSTSKSSSISNQILLPTHPNSSLTNFKARQRRTKFCGPRIYIGWRDLATLALMPCVWQPFPMEIDHNEIRNIPLILEHLDQSRKMFEPDIENTQFLIWIVFPIILKPGFPPQEIKWAKKLILDEMEKRILY